MMLPIWLDPTLFAAISALLLALVFLHRRTASAAAPTAEAGAVLRAPPWTFACSNQQLDRTILQSSDLNQSKRTHRTCKLN